MSEVGTQLSTSALAKRLGLPIQQLFVTLRDYGWIERSEDAWLLTAKGEIHGGSYQNSQRYGRYIVWPETLTEHPLISAIESDERLTPGGMCRYFSHLSARQIARLLGELGLIRGSRLGHQLTNLGEKFGGRQERDEASSLMVVTWPHEIVDHPVIHRELNRFQGDGRPAHEEPQDASADASPTAPQAEPGTDSQALEFDTAEEDATRDLFSTDTGLDRVVQAEHAHRGLDGHQLYSVLQQRVCDWLYGAQLAHAQNRALPVEEALSADFYVPAVGLYIECWDREVPTQELSRRLRTREVCRELNLAYLEVAAADASGIDELLSAKLAEIGHPR